MKTMFALAAAAAALAVAPANAATPFDLEGETTGVFPSVTVMDGSLSLTITSEARAGTVFIGGSGVGLVGQGAVANLGGGVFFGAFAPMRFTFGGVLDSVTFNYGDNGGDDDNPVSVSAFTAAGTLLGNVGGGYNAGETGGRSITAAFSGASYYILSSGSADGNPNSLLWDVASYTLAGGGGVPEPATWALMILGFGAVGGAMRRRSGRAVAVAA